MKPLSMADQKMLQERGVHMVVLFGSRAGDRFKPDSNYDLAVKITQPSEKKTAAQLIELIPMLARMLDIPEESVDISDLRQADPLFLYEIMQQSQLLFGSQVDYYYLQALARREYIATRDLRELEAFLVRKRQAFIGERLHAQ